MLRSFLPKSLLGRTILIVLFPIIAFQIILLTYYYNSLWERTLNRLSRSVSMEINMIYDNFITEQVDETQNKKFYDYYLIDVYLNDSPDFIEKENIKSEGPVISSFRGELSSYIDEDFFVSKSDDLIHLAISFEDTFVVFEFPEDRINTSRNHVFISWQVVSTIILVLIAYLFLKNQVKPIRTLARASEQFGKGQEVPNFKVSGALEVRQASLEFLKMKNRITRQIEQRSLMLAGVSHDLKTPLTRMKLINESVQDEELKTSLDEEISHMSEMLEEYLEFAAENELKSNKLINPIEALIKIKNDVHFQKHNIELEVLKDNDCLVNENIFVRVVTNILNNAILNSEKVVIKTEVSDEIVKVNIHDNGKGIPDNEKENVFKPFYRIDKSRNQNTVSSGLGLAITKSLLNSINGRIQLYDSYLGGLEVAIEIPN